MKRESTPFAILNVPTPENHPSKENGGIWAKFYWSQNSGVYGHQVITEYNTGKGFDTYKTNGCGYCKKSAALERFVSEVTNDHNSLGGDLDWYVNGTKYHQGGNSYEIPLSKLTKIDKLKG